MRRTAERPRVRVAAGLTVAVVPVYLALAPSFRPGVIRLAVAVFVGVALVHRVRALRASVDTAPPSEFERALAAPRPEPRLDPSFAQLREEIRHSTRSPRYFEHVLWPRLLALRVDGRERRPSPDGPANPPAGRWLRRGPSLSTLAGLIARVERQA